MSNKLIVTPEGEALYPHLHEPDYKYNSGGVYQVRLVLTEADWNDMKGTYDDFYAAEYAKASDKSKSTLEKDDATPFRQSDEGFYIMAKQVAQRQTRNKGVINFNVACYNATGKKIKMPQVGTGSRIKLALEPYAWVVSGNFGVGLRLRSVQIIDLVEFGSKDSIFGSVEGGFDGGEDFTTELHDEETQGKENGDFSF
tara:strand:- start:1985 stop:2578 length:594 start_codon:yes stop_codon:yes gene_type:complete